MQLAAALFVLVLPQDSAPTRSAPVFADGQAQVVPAFADSRQWIVHDLWVETEFDSDGDGERDRMHVDVTRPGQTESEGLRVPVIYETSPYFSGTGSTAKEHFWNPRQALGAEPPEHQDPPPIPFQSRRPRMSSSLVEDWVPRGFAVVHSASPGTGLSHGCPTVGGDNEALAPKAVIDWLNGRARGFDAPAAGSEVSASWSTGKVGMTGTSYNGTLPIAAATTGVEGLAALIPIAPNTSYYHYYRANGLVRHPGGWMGEDIDVLYNFINSGDPARREHCDGQVRDGLMAAGFDRQSGDYNDFWAGRDYVQKLAAYRAPTLVAHAFNDWNVMPSHSVRMFEALKAKGVPVQAYFHQGGHGGEPPFELQNRWFTRYLYGVENDVEHDPRAWIVREDAPADEPTPYADYPHPEAALVALYPTAGGRTQGGLVPERAPAQGREIWIDDVAHSGAELAQAAESAHRLLFATPPLAAPLHFSGRPRIRLRLAASAPAANLSVWLVALPWTEERRQHLNANLVNRGWADPQNHRSLTNGEPLVPGEFVELAFELEPDDQIVPVGESLGLLIFASDRDFTLWPPPGTEVMLDLDATQLELPVVGGAAALAAALGKTSGH